MGLTAWGSTSLPGVGPRLLAQASEPQATHSTTSTSHQRQHVPHSVPAGASFLLCRIQGLEPCSLRAGIFDPDSI